MKRAKGFGIEENMINPTLLQVLACPACDNRPPVKKIDHYMHCHQCNRKYPIKKGIPIMLIDEAIQEPDHDS